jgi:hypothetical protein
MKGTIVNRSEKIRDYLKTLKPSDRSPKAVADALTAKGVKVTPTLVSLVKRNMRLKAKGKSRKNAPAKAHKPRKVKTNKVMTLKEVAHAKEFLEMCGGLANAKNFLGAVNEILS